MWQIRGTTHRGGGDAWTFNNDEEDGFLTLAQTAPAIVHSTKKIHWKQAFLFIRGDNLQDKHNLVFYQLNSPGSSQELWFGS